MRTVPDRNRARNIKVDSAHEDLVVCRQARLDAVLLSIRVDQLVDPGRRSEDGRTALFKLCREVVVSQTELR